MPQDFDFSSYTTKEWQQFNAWCVIEVIVFIGCIVANTIYLFVRAFSMQTLTLSVPQLLINENTDYLESQQILLGMFVTFCVPACILTYIQNACNTEAALQDDFALTFAST